MVKAFRRARFPPRRTFISGSPPKTRSASPRSNKKSSAHHLCSMPMPSGPFSGATVSASTWRYVPDGARSQFSGRVADAHTRNSSMEIAHMTAKAQTSKMGEELDSGGNKRKRMTDCYSGSRIANGTKYLRIATGSIRNERPTLPRSSGTSSHLRSQAVLLVGQRSSAGG